MAKIRNGYSALQGRVQSRAEDRERERRGREAYLETFKPFVAWMEEALEALGHHGLQTSGSLPPVTVTLGSIFSNPARLFLFRGLASRK